jgi:hypothetical protein
MKISNVRPWVVRIPWIDRPSGTAVHAPGQRGLVLVSVFVSVAEALREHAVTSE